MIRAKTSFRIAMSVIVTVLLTSCGDKSPSAPETPETPQTPPPPAVVRVGRVTVTPATLNLVSGERGGQFTATVYDSAGNVLTGRVVTWSSSSSQIVSVGSLGIVVGLKPGGPITITATCEGKIGTATVMVTAPFSLPILITPAALVLSAGDSLQLMARDSAGNDVSGPLLEWSSADTTVVQVSSRGIARAIAPGGPITVTATRSTLHGVAAVTVSLMTGLHDVRVFLDRCPANDGAFAQITSDFDLRVDGQPVTSRIACSEPVSAMSVDSLSEELIVLQALRAAYYMGRGTQGHLPWTPLALYEWMHSRVSGINIKTAPGMLYCCDDIDGRLYVSMSRYTTHPSDFSRTWPGISGALAYLAHEMRHADPGAPAHTTGCLEFPLPTDPSGCDVRYNTSNLSAYGIQYWLNSKWAAGYLNVGIGCAPAAIAAMYAQSSRDAANGFFGRFVIDPPPRVAAAQPYGGQCNSLL